MRKNLPVKQLTKSLALLSTIVVVGITRATGQVITFDEFGNGTFGPGVIQADPGPGGLPAVMTYPLPFAGTIGDLLVHDPLEGGLTLDVIRWNGNGTLCFYSDNLGGTNAPADTAAPPQVLYSNQANANEGGVEGGFRDLFYTPQPGQPGFDPNNPNWTYHLISDVPEPASVTFLLVGAGFLGLRRIRQKLSV